MSPVIWKHWFPFIIQFNIQASPPIKRWLLKCLVPQRGCYYAGKNIKRSYEFKAKNTITFKLIVVPACMNRAVGMKIFCTRTRLVWCFLCILLVKLKMINHIIIKLFLSHTQARIPLCGLPFKSHLLYAWNILSFVPRNAFEIQPLKVSVKKTTHIFTSYVWPCLCCISVFQMRWKKNYNLKFHQDTLPQNSVQCTVFMSNISQKVVTIKKKLKAVKSVNYYKSDIIS